MHSGGLELAKLTYTRLEDNLIRHRGDRRYMFPQPPPHTHTRTQVRRLLEKGCPDLDKGDKFGQTPLHIACHREGLLGCLKLLAAHHVNMKALDANGNTALHSAAGSGAAAAAEFLLGRGLSVADRNKDGHTPMVRGGWV